MKFVSHIFLVMLFNQFTLLNSQCWIDISIGVNHVLALKSDSTIWTWGENVYGQLGIGNVVDQNKPIQVGTDKDWKIIETGSHHCFAIKNDGSLWAWGSNSIGELGIESMSSYKNKPIQVGVEKNWKIVSCGTTSTFAIKNDGTLWGWGGIIGSTETSKPLQIGSDNKWISISNCSEHLLLLKNNGTIWSIGKNYYGQLGLGIFSDPVYTFSQIGFNDDWEFVLAYEGVSFGIVSGGVLRIWGRLNNDESRTWNTPRDPFGIRHYWKNISANRYNLLGVKDNGTLWGCGYNEFGQLSNGSKTLIYEPTQIGTESNWNKVAVGIYGNSFAIKKDGTLWTCGRNDKGQLGNGTYRDTSNFIQVNCQSNNAVVDNNSINSEILIYPNPSKGEITIDLSKFSAIPTSISIKDLNGKYINSITNLTQRMHSNQQIIIDNHTLEKGTYFLALTFNSRIIMKKFMVY